jgi:hypothetical protein
VEVEFYAFGGWDYIEALIGDAVLKAAATKTLVARFSMVE